MNKIRKILRRLYRLWQLSSQYDNDFNILTKSIGAAHDRIGRHTIVHADIHWEKPHQIIVVGRWRNRDHVRVFDLDEKDWVALVEQLHYIEKNAKVGRFDTPHSMSFSVVYDRDRL